VKNRQRALARDQPDLFIIPNARLEQLAAADQPQCP
jgi:hypothetical protein